MGYNGVVCRDPDILDTLYSVSVRPTGLMNAHENGIYKFTKGLCKLFIKIDDGVDTVKFSLANMVEKNVDTGECADLLDFIVRVPIHLSISSLQFTAYKYAVLILCAYDKCGGFNRIESESDRDLFNSTLDSFIQILKNLKSKIDSDIIDWEIFDKEPFNKYGEYLLGGIGSDED